MAENVLLCNSRVVQHYFQGSAWVADLNAVLYTAVSKFHPSTATPLGKLVSSEMKRKEAVRTKLLDKLSYNIDEPESVQLVCLTLRIEAVSS